MTDDIRFRRQPLPVTVRIEGEPIDVAFWRTHFIRTAGAAGDNVEHVVDSVDGKWCNFKIYPRAVND